METEPMEEAALTSGAICTKVMYHARKLSAWASPDEGVAGGLCTPRRKASCDWLNASVRPTLRYAPCNAVLPYGLYCSLRSVTARSAFLTSRLGSA